MADESARANCREAVLLFSAALMCTEEQCLKIGLMGLEVM